MRVDNNRECHWRTVNGRRRLVEAGSARRYCGIGYGGHGGHGGCGGRGGRRADDGCRGVGRSVR